MNQTTKETLIEKGLSLGAKDIIAFDQKDLVFDPRTYLKCLFGCGEGKPFCPTKNDAALVQRYKKMIADYQWGLLIRSSEEKTGQDIALALERLAFLAGNPFALALCGCAYCEDCNYVEGKDCVNPQCVRLPLCAAGLDVFGTVKGLGWELEILRTMEDAPSYITMVLVD